MLVDEQVVSFSTFDRCDRCGAQAYAQAEKWGAKAHLLFCVHHAREHDNALADDGWTVRWDMTAVENLVSPHGASAW